MKPEDLQALRDKLLLPVAMKKDAEGKEFPVCAAELEFKQVRNRVSALLRIMDPQAFEKYRALKVQDGGSLKARREAYAFAFQALCTHCYNITGL